MKICHLAIPAIVWSQDDSSTLLSLNLKVHSTLEAGVDQLLETVGSRNVTQMSAFLQNLVEDVISQDAQGSADPYKELDSDVYTALEMIKNVLLGDIRGALKEAHCYDQTELHTAMLCFEQCESEKKTGADSCVSRCDGSAHKTCRDELLGKYTDHITACRALDQFVFDFSKKKCPKFDKSCCQLPHTTWNCQACAGQIGAWAQNLDESIGDWIKAQVFMFSEAYDNWGRLHSECAQDYHEYVAKDAECDCLQAECEITNCKHDDCHYVNCEGVYNTCWGKCEDQMESIEKNKECLEKDRKIDWSATEKIECYVNVLLEKPDNETLLKTCGNDHCYNEYREQMYHKCNDICVEVDFDGKMAKHDRRKHEEGTSGGRNASVKDQTTHREADIDVTGEGDQHVRTRHRGAGENRCTSHLDLDYQEPPCCHPCQPRPSPPCEDAYMHDQYHQYNFLSEEAVPDIGSTLSDGIASQCSSLATVLGGDCDNTLATQTCFAGEHTNAYAYNLCPCIACTHPTNVYPAAKCTDGKSCAADTTYDYRKHDIKVDCSLNLQPSIDDHPEVIVGR